MLFPYLLKVSFLLGVLTLSYRWLIKYETFSKINRVLLFLNVAAAWSLPLIPLAGWGPVDVQSEFHQKIPVVGKTFPAVLQTNTAEIHSDIKARGAVSNLALEDFLIGAYFLGVLFMSLRLFYQLKGILCTLWSLPWEKLGKRLRLIRDINATSPYSFFYWIICNPETHSPEQLQHILAHESVHAGQWHSLDLLASELQKILLWFNPVAWFHQRLVQENLEYIADHAVLENGFERKRYQFSLVNVALRTTELPMTNSFAQSLLKNRIKMMNRKPSRYWVLGKYALLIALLYVSSAFVAPYKDQIIKLSPSIAKPLMVAILPEYKKLPETSAGLEKSPITPKTNEVPQAETTPVQQVQPNLDSARMTTKGILIRNDTLYWAISALTTWDDINMMKKEIKEFGAELNVNSFKFDPLNLFLTSISISTSARGASGQGSSSEEEKEEEFKPMRICSGFLMKHSVGMGQLPPASLLASVDTDYQRAVLLRNENEVTFGEHKIMKTIGESGSTGFLKQTLNGKDADSFFIKQGIGKSSQNTLSIGERLKNAEFYLNAKPAKIEEVSSLNFENFISATIVDNWKGKYYVLIRAK